MCEGAAYIEVEDLGLNMKKRWKRTEESKYLKMNRPDLRTISGYFLGVKFWECALKTSLYYCLTCYFIIVAIPQSNCVCEWVRESFHACMCMLWQRKVVWRLLHQLCITTNATVKSSQTVQPLLRRVIALHSLGERIKKIKAVLEGCFWHFWKIILANV